MWLEGNIKGSGALWSPFAIYISTIPSSHQHISTTTSTIYLHPTSTLLPSMPKATKDIAAKKFPARNLPYSRHMPAGALHINYLKLPITWRFKVPIVRSIEVIAAVGNVPIPYDDFGIMFRKLYPEKPRNTANIKDMINIITWKLE